MSFVWTDAEKASVTSGSTVVVHSGVCPVRRYTVHEVYAHGGGVSVDGGYIMLAWSCLDPSTLSVPDSRQIDLFDGK